jgi:methylmalonyl-CoA/ethylmalonyl-CoA epimerase
MNVLDHIGIAVRSIEERGELYRALGLEISAEEDVPTEKVKVAFLPLAGTRLELVEPTAPDSPVASFISKRGEGLHHLCFAVSDVTAVMADLSSKGFKLLSAEPLPGAHGCKVCFIHPKSAGGVLIELSQPPDTHNELR